MYLGVDIGGTKVLMASFTNESKMTKSFKFPTPKTYPAFLNAFEKNLLELDVDDFLAAGVAIPGLVDRKRGVGIRFGNLGWTNVPIRKDLERILNCPVALENDAKAGGLAEAMLIKDDFKKVMYVAIGTGIGLAYIKDGVIDETFGDRGGNALMLDFNGKSQSWESFASGKAIVARFGKRAADITSERIWKRIAHDFAIGIVDLIALFEIDAIVLGGGVGSHFERYEKFLKAELKQYATPLMPIPVIVQAKRPEETVAYGGYFLAKDLYGNVTQ